MQENLGSGSGFGHGLLGNGGLLFVKVTDGECSKSLHKTGSVVASWGITEGKHGLCEFSIELGLGVAQGRLNVNNLLDVVEGSVHFENLGILSEVLFRSVGELDSWGGGRKLGGGRGPFDLGALIEEVAGVEVGNTFLLDATNTEGLLVFLVKLGWQNFNDQVSILLLGVDVGIEVGLTGFDGGHDGFEGVSTLFHVTLDLPVELDFIGDVKVEGEVKEVANTLVVHGVKTFEDDDGGGLDGFGGVEGSVNVVVDGLADGFSVLEGLNLLVHEVEVVLKGVKSGSLGYLTALTVVKVVVIKADNGGEVRDKGVGFPSTVVETTSEGSDNVTSEDGGKTTHESGLSASGVSGNTDDNWGLSFLECHVEAAAGGRTIYLGERSEGGGRSHGKGGDTNSEFHFFLY